MNIYWCFEKSDYCGLYVIAETRGQAKRIYADEVTEYCIQGPCPNFKTVEQIKTEAFKEFVKRLKENTITKSEFD